VNRFILKRSLGRSVPDLKVKLGQRTGLLFVGNSYTSKSGAASFSIHDSLSVSLGEAEVVLTSLPTISCHWNAYQTSHGSWSDTAVGRATGGASYIFFIFVSMVCDAERAE
jgi:hypothetical protein